MVRINFLTLLLNLLKNVFSIFNVACSKVQHLLEICLFTYQLSVIMLLLLLRAGDVETNPGPGDNEHTLSNLHLYIINITIFKAVHTNLYIKRTK